MTYLKQFGAALCLLISLSSIKAQMQGYNLLVDGDETYLILDSPMEYEGCFDAYSIRAIYRIEEDQLILDSILSNDEGRLEASCGQNKVGEVVEYSGGLYVSLIDGNEKQIRKILAKGGVAIDPYYSELMLVSFDAGKRLDEFCVGESQRYCSEAFGQLSAMVWQNNAMVQILKNDEVIYDFTNNEDYGEVFLLLPTGEYVVRTETWEGVIEEDKVKVEEGIVRYYDEPMYGYGIDGVETVGYGTELYTTGVIAWDFLYSNASMYSMEENEAPSSYHFGMKGGLEFLSNKLGTSKLFGTYGVDIDYTKLDNELDSIGSKEVKRTSFLGVYYTADVFFRQYFNLPLAKRVTRPCLDIGVSYKLPMYFRKNIAIQGYRFSEKWLHKYNELVVFTRVGISNGAALNVSYRPFSSVKNGLPELPKLQFGITFMLDIY